MKSRQFIENKENGIIREISHLINNHIFSKLNYKNYNIFLVGAGKENPNSIRDIIRKELTEWQYINRMDVYYPEELFEELMKNKPYFDLLSLENILAKSVHAIVIILESPGSIAELGAFSNHNLLQDKLVVIVDKKYKNKKSFINYGLLRFLGKTKSRIIFHDFSDLNFNVLDNIDELMSSIKKYMRSQKFIEKVRKSIRDISEKVKIDNTVSNPILAQYFLLSAIYIMEPIKKEKINLMLQSIISEGIRDSIDKPSIEIIFHSALNILLLRKEVSLRDEKYYLTQTGINRLYQSSNLYNGRADFEENLDDMRIKLLNSTLRGDLYRNQRRELNDLSWAI